jgi:protein-S-isoprenylcysteine O-methyltransferase Ste14
LTLAIYSLSFWHYYLYWLAYLFGAVSLGAFKRHAIAMKTVALIALAFVYLAAPPDLLSLTVVASGFLLNVVAARALGSDRTYYGHEVAGLPRRHITAFPYSWISHPMLTGNIAAFGGTMLNPDFRQQWWPLACAHVAMNVGLLIMELAVTPQRRGARRALIGAVDSGARWYSMQTGGGMVAAGAVLGAALGSWGTWRTHTLLAAGMGACILAYAYVLYCCYSTPTLPSGERREVQAEGTS